LYGLPSEDSKFEEVVEVAWIEICGLVASKYFMAQGTAKIRQVLQAGKILSWRTA
jgi:hypothetical protein